MGMEVCNSILRLDQMLRRDYVRPTKCLSKQEQDSIPLIIFSGLTPRTEAQIVDLFRYFGPHCNLLSSLLDFEVDGDPRGSIANP